MKSHLCSLIALTTTVATNLPACAAESQEVEQARQPATAQPATAPQPAATTQPAPPAGQETGATQSAPAEPAAKAAEETPAKASPANAEMEPSQNSQPPESKEATPKSESAQDKDSKPKAEDSTTPSPEGKTAEEPKVETPRKRPANVYAIPLPEDAGSLAAGTNLVLQGIPKPSMSLVDDINRYTEYRRAIFCDWHPVKRQMTIETRFADTTQIHLLNRPAGAREQLTFYRDASHSGTFVPADADLMVFSKDKGGDEFYQKYCYSFSNKKVELLTDGKSRNTGGVWSSSGARFAYGSTRRNGKDVDIYVVTPPNRATTIRLAELKGGGWKPLDWSIDDKTILAQEVISANCSRLWLVDTKFGTKELLAPADEEEKVYYGDAKFSKDGKGVYTITDKDTEFQRLTYIDLENKKHTCLTESIPWDILEFDLSKDGTKIAFAANEDGLAKLHLLNTKNGKEVTVPDLPAGQVSELKWHSNSRDLAFNIENASTPEDVYTLSLDNGSIERWTKSETGMLDMKDASTPELIHWKSFDDKAISGFLYRPPAKFSGKHPVLISIHGGPESQWRPRFLGATNYLLNELGIAIIYPNVRGSTGYGKTFSQLDNGLQRADSYKDIGALLEWIKAKEDFDASKIMIMGGSYGGNMTLACSMLYSDSIKCSLDAFGPSNFVTFLKNTQPYRQDLRRVEYGDERDPKVEQFLQEIAPLNHADSIKKPLFVVQGDNDPRVPVSESDQMVKAVRKSGTPVWYLRAKDEGHGFTKKVNTDYLFFTTVEFIKQYLLN
ncbi:MAG TPA: prolyl oligopeptidase family serine peptidase [Oculatellaceae cyanobacterium]